MYIRVEDGWAPLTSFILSNREPDRYVYSTVDKLYHETYHGKWWNTEYAQGEYEKLFIRADGTDMRENWRS